MAVAWTAAAQPTFLGHKIAVTAAELDDDGFYPKGPATVCVELSPRQCYTAPKEFGRDPKVEIVDVKPGKPAILFTALSGGVSGYLIHLALLQPGRDRLDNLLPLDFAVSNQGEYAVWKEASLSPASLLLTADFVWGPNESHYEPHRYIVSTYALRSSTLLDEPTYYLEDRFMTVRRYDLERHTDILASERPEILARLRRLKASRR